MRHLRFGDFPSLLGPGDLLVLNDTRVIPARLHARRSTGGAVRILFVREIGGGLAEVMLASRGRIEPGERFKLEDSGVLIAAEEKIGGGRWILRAPECGWPGILRHGRPPLPPYIKRPFEGDADLERDRERYQTVYAARDGSIAAPTAGLHFDSETLARAAASCFGVTAVTLHVGPGTFKPVECEELDDHEMQAEECEITHDAALEIAAALAEGRRIVAVGTTTTRCLESAAGRGCIAAGRFSAGLFIRPPYRFRAVSALLTNFHLPGSTLIALVAAFAGVGRTLEAYRAAVEQKYRFHSYGDAMFLELPGPGPSGSGE